MADRRAPGRRKAPHGSATPVQPGGRRRAPRARAPFSRLLPPTPVLAGVAVLALAAGGAVTASDDSVAVTSADAAEHTPKARAAGALSGETGDSTTSLLEGRGQVVSRDSARDTLAASSQSKIQKAAEAMSQERNAALAKFAQKAEQQAKQIALNAWVLPVDSYRITNTFGLARSYYSSGYHTGLDFAAPSGTPIHAVANGVITSAAYEGAYGNQTVQTLDDGTELWYCHQTSFTVSPGDTVRAGEIIGYVGSTGNSTGPHLHLEVRPGAGDPVDPAGALHVHGLNP